MQEAVVVLDVLRERGRKGLPFAQLYRQMFNKELYLLAYGNIYQGVFKVSEGRSFELVAGVRSGGGGWGSGCCGHFAVTVGSLVGFARPRRMSGRW
jgi:hypothetical protein